MCGQPGLDQQVAGDILERPAPPLAIAETGAKAGPGHVERVPLQQYQRCRRKHQRNERGELRVGDALVDDAARGAESFDQQVRIDRRNLVERGAANVRWRSRQGSRRFQPAPPQVHARDAHARKLAAGRNGFVRRQYALQERRPGAWQAEHENRAGVAPVRPADTSNGCRVVARDESVRPAPVTACVVMRGLGAEAAAFGKRIKCSVGVAGVEEGLAECEQVWNTPRGFETGECRTQAGQAPEQGVVCAEAVLRSQRQPGDAR